MPVIDNDEAIRDRAYDLWEKAGRLSGLEHVHWAEAKRQIAFEAAPEIDPLVTYAEKDEVSGESPKETLQLRSALYAPEPFSFELFGQECPDVEVPIVLRAA